MERGVGHKTDIVSQKMDYLQVSDVGMTEKTFVSEIIGML